MLLTIQPHDEARHVDDLFPHTDVALADEDAGVVDGAGEAEFVDLGLQAAFQEIFDFQSEHVVESHAGFVQDTDAHQSADQSVAFE